MTDRKGVHSLRMVRSKEFLKMKRNHLLFFFFANSLHILTFDNFSPFIYIIVKRAPLVPQSQRIHLPMQEMWGLSLGPEDLLEKELTVHSSILSWEIPWTEDPGMLQSMGLQKSWTRLSN